MQTSDPRTNDLIDTDVRRTGTVAQSVKYIPASIFPALYAVHRLYRSYRPRRLPTFTSLTLLELYVAAATPVLVKCISVPDAVDAMLDEDGYTIILASKRLRGEMARNPNIHQSFKNLDATNSQTPRGRELQARLKWLREGMYILVAYSSAVYAMRPPVCL